MVDLDVRPDEAPASAGVSSPQSRGYYVEIFVVSFAALLLEVCYTRVISFKFFYYWTYLVIGLALLGIGAGGVLVALSERLRRAATERLLMWSFLIGGALVGICYLVVATTHVDTVVIWEYKPSAVENFFLLIVVCLAMFASFIPAGIVLSTLFGRRTDRIGTLYFVDLIGAGVACAIVVTLISTIGPPAAIFLAGLLMAAVAIRIAVRLRSRLMPVAGLVLVLLAIPVVSPSVLPNISTDAYHIDPSTAKTIYSAWNPVFRIDVVQYEGVRLFYHDGVLGSEMFGWNGKDSSLGQYGFDHDPRALPFNTLGMPPRNVTIIGAAGGHEVLTSLYFHAGHVDAVELNPTTYQLVTKTFANYDGHLAQNPRVTYIFGDGRSYLARTDKKSNLIWYPAPDSYAATNAATASAFVLSESYLYTTQAVITSLQHLNPGGILAAQFGEYDYAAAPLRTTRYVETVRLALKEMGISDPGSHILVSTAPATGDLAGLSTILVKATPFTPAQVGRFVHGIGAVPGAHLAWASGYRVPNGPVAIAAGGTSAQLNAFNHNYRYSVTPISDNKPFFWHFATFSNVIENFTTPLSHNQEVATGERVLILLLGVTVLLGIIFLLLPFLAVKKEWLSLERKGTAALYFGAIGFGFIFFEVTLIQLLTLFLGYPTYALTVTLCSILIFVGIGSLLSSRWKRSVRLAPGILFVAIALLTIFYLYGLVPTTNALLHLPMAARVPIAFGLMAPLGLCLGMFMPLGLGAVARLSSAPREYVAWGWAVNGFATVAGSVLATMLAMTYGFGSVLVVALLLYGVAALSLNGLLRAAKGVA
jgi:spermidine synthase